MLNFQSVVSQFFEYESSVVVRRPLPFIIIPPMLTIIIVYLTVEGGIELNVTNDTLQVFLPDDMESLSDLRELTKLFPPSDAQRDTYSVLGSKFVYTIVASEDNVLDTQGIREIVRLHRWVRTLKKNNKKHEDICLKDETISESTCLLHPIAMALEDDESPEFAIQFLLRYPLVQFSDVIIDNALIFGGVQVDANKTDSHGNSPIVSAKAIRIMYLVEPTVFGEQWIDEFLRMIPTYASNLTIFWTSSKSLANEMERNGALLIPWMPPTSLLLVVFCMIVCSSKDIVKSQPFVGFFAMFNAVMATVASTALLIYLRYPFLPLVFIMPFLVVSIGTDNMFLMLKSWRMTDESIQDEQRYIDALTESAASLFLTSLTDGLSFAIGSVSNFHAVRVFCTYCAMAILFMFIYQVTFFNAVMSMCCRRQVANRHPIICCWKMKRKLPRVDPILHSYSQNHKPASTKCIAHWLSDLLDPWYSRVITLIIFLIYIIVSIHYAMSLPLGLDLKLLAPDDSYVTRELDAQERFFSDYGSYCVAVVRITNQTQLVTPRGRLNLIDVYKQIGASPYASCAEFWLESIHLNSSVDNLREFQEELFTFLGSPHNIKFRSDIRFKLNGEIEAIKMLFRVRKLGKENDGPRAEYMRRIMKNSGLDGFVYDTSFLLVDQQLTTVWNVICDVITAICTMLAICILMVPRPISAICIALAILSVNIGVIGALSASETRLDIISMITIVMSVGFSVDYVTHTTFHYVITRTDRLKNCLLVMTEPILQSAFSTAIGVSLLAFVQSYIVRTFVYTVVFVVGLGIIHGLVFLPVLLDSVVPQSEYMIAYEPKHTTDSDNYDSGVYSQESHIYDEPI